MGEGDSETPIGVVLMENLTKALLQNTNAQIVAVQEYRELREEIKLLREDLEGVGGITEDVLGHATTFLRILDHVTMASADRPPKWKDVQEVLQEIKDEIQQQEAQEAQEEREAGQGQEIFPHKKSS